MKTFTLLSSLLFVALGCSAQIEIEILTRDMHSKEPLQHSLVRPSLSMHWGSYNYDKYKEDAEYARAYKIYNIQQLKDSFEVQAIGYAPEKGILTEFRYDFYNKKIDMYVNMRPWLSQYSIDLPVAKSKKVKTDTVYIKAYSPRQTQFCAISLHQADGKKICDFALEYETSGIHVGKLPLAALQDGYFEVNYSVAARSQPAERFPFKKSDWAQLHCLMLDDRKPNSPKEMDLLIAYFQQAKNNDEYLQRVYRTHSKKIEEKNEQIHQLHDKIEEQQYEILSLKEGKRIVPPPKPAPEPEPEPVAEPEPELYISNYEDAHPENEKTIPALLETLKQQAAQYECPYSGNISFDLIVKNGEVICRELHCSPKAEALAQFLAETIEKTSWSPAMVGGRPHPQRFILSFNLVVVN